METQQVVFAAVILGIAAFYIRRYLLSKSITHYDPSSVSAKLKSREGIVLLDVRTDGERSARRIDGSLHIPLHELRRRMNELEKHRGKEIICYCASGNRSLSAALIMKKQGFRVGNLEGGMSRWLLGS